MAKKKAKPRKIDWKKTPFAVVVGRGVNPRGVFPTVDEALAWVQGQPPEVQIQAFIGQFFPLKVNTKAELSTRK